MAEPESSNSYSRLVGLVFVFNIIVGTGALTLPAAFSKAGWALGTISISFLAFVSFVTATYVIECLACANTFIKWKSSLTPTNADNEDGSDSDSGINEHTPMRPGHLSEEYFSLDNRVELGEMAKMFFNPFGRLAFYIIMIVYLYGDLSIYSVAIAKSTMDVVCTYSPSNRSEISFDSPCFNQTVIDDSLIFTRLKCYRMVLLTFMMALGPFVFFNVQKTKHLQIFTSITRWLAFIIMITLAVKTLITEGPKGSPPAFKMAGIPALFGSCVYSFMCHHSIPGIISPITPKRRLSSLISIDFFLIAIFYLLLALTGVFAFEHLEDLYTLNFVPKMNTHQSLFLKIIEYFLGLFPVFTLTTSFPVIAITLRNTIQGMFLDIDKLESYNIVLRRLLFPLVAILPPLFLTLFFEDITLLVSITGSYGGTGIQYLIPTFMVLAARKKMKDIFGDLHVTNKYESPFKHTLWAIFIFAWSAVCIVLVSLNLIEKKFTHVNLY